MLRLARVGSAVALGAITLLATSAPSAAPAAVDIQLDIGASTTVPTQNVRTTPNGGTVTIQSLRFYVFVDIALVTPAPSKAKVRVELSEGLSWGPDDPDPTENCTSTARTGECETVELQPTAGGSVTGWYWDVVAAQPGTYTWKAEIVETAVEDPNLSNNSSQITIVVTESAGGGGSGGGSSGGGGGGGGGAVTVSASAARLTPSKPKAGSAVTASVRVRAGGAAIRPTRVACSGSIGPAKLKGAARAALGAAACTFRTPRAAKGKLLRGSVAFTAGGKRFTKRFSARLG